MGRGRKLPDPEVVEKEIERYEDCEEDAGKTITIDRFYAIIARAFGSGTYTGERGFKILGNGVRIDMSSEEGKLSHPTDDDYKKGSLNEKDCHQVSQ